MAASRMTQLAEEDLSLFLFWHIDWIGAVDMHAYKYEEEEKHTADSSKHSTAFVPTTATVLEESTEKEKNSIHPNCQKLITSRIVKKKRQIKKAEMRRRRRNVWIETLTFDATGT